MNQLLHNQKFSVQAGDIAGLLGNVFPLLGAMNRWRSAQCKSEVMLVPFGRCSRTKRIGLTVLDFRGLACMQGFHVPIRKARYKR